MTLEKEVERACCDYAFRRGWFECKFTSPSRRGMPDRFFARARNGIRRVVLVEFKRPGETPTEQQAELHKTLREHGVEVFWISSIDQMRRVFI